MPGLSTNQQTSSSVTREGSRSTFSRTPARISMMRGMSARLLYGSKSLSFGATWGDNLHHAKRRTAVLLEPARAVCRRASAVAFTITGSDVETGCRAVFQASKPEPRTPIDAMLLSTTARAKRETLMRTLAGALMGVVTGLIASAGSVPAAAQQAVSIESRFAQANGVRLHYLIAGKGDPVLLLHGYAQNSHMWRPLIAELARRTLSSLPTCAASAIRPSRRRATTRRRWRKTSMRSPTLGYEARGSPGTISA